MGFTRQQNQKPVCETIGPVKDKASQSKDSAGQVRDGLSDKSKHVKDYLSGDNRHESLTDWAKETIGIKHDENYPNVEDTVSDTAKDATKRKAGEAKERLEETVEAVKEKAEMLKEEAERESKNAKEKSKEHYESAKERLKAMTQLLSN